MADPPFPWGDSLDVDQARAWLEECAARGQMPRGPDRRVADRRKPTFEVRRADDVALNLRRRERLMDVLTELNRSELLLWIELKWLPYASDAELLHLEEKARIWELAHSPGKRGRPRAALLPGLSALDETELRSRWMAYRERFKVFAEWRRKHWARANLTRRGTPRSQEFRRACFETPVGLAVFEARLFDEFFGTSRLEGGSLRHAYPSPAEMAARYLHCLEERRLTELELFARRLAKSARSRARKALCLKHAENFAEQREKLGSWTTFYTKLKKPI